MALEMRGRHGPYYTRSVRRNGRVTREYLGAGSAALLQARLDQIERELRTQERREARQRQAEQDEAERMLGEFFAEVESYLRSSLQAAGYRQHHRGEWRRKRGGKTDAGTERRDAAGS